MEKKDILQEITPLESHDFMFVADRHKAGYDYPLHRHDLFEMNFVEHGAGCERIVGDSVETIGEYDLVLITSPNLEHMWGQGECQNTDIHDNFNRLFKKRKGCSPTEFREKYAKTKVIV